MKKIVIVAAKRTPQGRFLGALVKYSAIDLAVAAGKSVCNEVDPNMIDQVIMGNVLGAGLGMNIARQISVGIGIPVERTAYTVNMMCASGMHAIILAAQTIAAGNANVILCGGTESMSNAPYLLARARGGYKFGDGILIDSILSDGLSDSFSKEHMGSKAEKLAQMYSISRSEQDQFAAASQAKYAKAHADGQFREELVTIKELDKDEHPRPETTVEQLAILKPVFKKDGTVTAGNSSGINDGAAILAICDEETAAAHGWRPLAVISGWAEVGCDPQLMGLGPVHATKKLCQQQGKKLTDFEVFELNEAFAAQSIACIKELGLRQAQLNVHGGAIALGHPIGASGARIVIHLAHMISKKICRNGLATLCVGGGMGATLNLEAYDKK
jgi:acetyl-CoA C-acetyltransferase